MFFIVHTCSPSVVHLSSRASEALRTKALRGGRLPAPRHRCSSTLPWHNWWHGPGHTTDASVHSAHKNLENQKKKTYLYVYTYLIYIDHYQSLSIVINLYSEWFRIIHGFGSFGWLANHKFHSCCKLLANLGFPRSVSESSSQDVQIRVALPGGNS